MVHGTMLLKLFFAATLFWKSEMAYIYKLNYKHNTQDTGTNDKPETYTVYRTQHMIISG